jgi:hypothetical protein
VLDLFDRSNPTIDFLNKIVNAMGKELEVRIMDLFDNPVGCLTGPCNFSPYGCEIAVF